MLDLKHSFHSINLTEDSNQYTSCCASPWSPTYQYKLNQGLNFSPPYFTSLKNDLLHALPADIHEYIHCMMDDVIIFTPDVKTNRKVLKSFMLMLKKYGMLLTIIKVHTFRSKVKYIYLYLASGDKNTGWRLKKPDDMLWVWCRLVPFIYNKTLLCLCSGSSLGSHAMESLGG